jgi:hypothetical protein
LEGEISGTRRWRWSAFGPVFADLLRIMLKPLFLAGLAGSLSVVFVVVPIVYMELYRDRVIPGVKVLTEQIGGKESEEAARAIERGAARLQSVPLVLEAGGQRWQVRPAELGVRIDVNRTLTEVLSLGRGEFPTKTGILAAGALLWGIEYPAVLHIDDGRLNSFLEIVGARVRVPAKDAGLVVKDGRVERQVDQPGVQLDMEAARRAILRAIARGQGGEISLPLTVEMPRLNWHSVAPYEEKLTRSLSGTVLVTAGNYGELISGPRLWKLVRGTAFDPAAPDRVGIALDPDGAASLVAALQLKAGKPARDASIRVSIDGQVVIEPESVGVGVTEQGLRQALTAALLGGDMVATVPLEPVAYPVVTTEDLVQARARAEHILAWGVTLFFGDRSWELGRRELASALGFSGVGRGTEPRLDPGRLADVIAGLPFGLDVPGRVEKVAWWGGPVVAGQSVDPLATAEAVAQAVSQGRSFVELRFRPSLPELPAAKMPAEKPGKWIDVNLTSQALVAYEGEVPVYYTLVSTGRPGHSTPTGTFRIYIKLIKDSMSNGTFGVSPEDPDYYNLKDVPYVMYFLSGGYAIHGTYWHSNFGHVMSHGCVNAPTPAAQWIFQWAELGTPVVVHY